MKLHVKSNFLRLSHPSRFSIKDILFKAKFKYSSSFNLLKFSIFSIMLFYKYKIFKCLHNLSRFSIFSISY